MLKASIFLLLVSMYSFSAYPHGGGLNDDGCHTNSESDDYHCHGDKKKDFNNIELISLDGDKCIKGNKSLTKGSVCEGKVVGISDGDTITLLIDKTTYKIRLAQIDTPERKQPYGSKSKRVLSDLIFGKEIKVKIETIDRYGRYVADVYLEDTHINAELVKLGAAWVYMKYVKDRSLIDLEKKARIERIGLWALPEEQIQPPWEWRRRN